MKFSGKLKVLMMSLALLGSVAVTPVTTNAATITMQINQTDQINKANEPLHKGMKNSNVKPLQKQLKQFDYYHYHIDGIFGKLTFQALEDFQKDNGLNADGIAGEETKKKLQEMNALKQIYKKAPLLKRGSQGKIIKDVQSQLKDLDYYMGHLDGKFGPLTEKAVIGFQKANDITVDGIVGPETYAALIHNPVRKPKEETTVTESTTTEESSDKNKTVVESVSTGPDNSEKSQASDDANANANANTDANVADVSQDVDHSSVRTLYVESTAYTAHCPGCSGITATGINLLKNPGAKVIAVDPSVIPLGSKVWVEGYGYAIAGDTGGAINGRRIDVFISSHSKAMHWGRKRVKVKVFG